MHTHTRSLIKKHLHAVIIYSSSLAGNLLYLSTSLEAKETKLGPFLICLKSRDKQRTWCTGTVDIPGAISGCPQK